MRKMKMLIISMMIGGMMLSATAAFANGYPFGIIDTSSTSTKVIVIGKFSTQFTQQEAQNACATVISLISGSTGGTLFYTPNDFASMGLGDADSLKSIVNNSYTSWGFNLYIFIDIKKAGEYSPGFGNNVRIDIYVADMAAVLGVNADYLYVLSIETSQLLLNAAGSSF